MRTKIVPAALNAQSANTKYTLHSTHGHEKYWGIIHIIYVECRKTKGYNKLSRRYTCTLVGGRQVFQTMYLALYLNHQTVHPTKQEEPFKRIVRITFFEHCTRLGYSVLEPGKQWLGQ